MTAPTPGACLDVSDKFLQRARRLSNYIGRAHKAGRGTILFAVWRHVSVRRMVDAALAQLLESEGYSVKKVGIGEAPFGGLVSHLVEAARSLEDVLFIYDPERSGARASAP